MTNRINSATAIAPPVEGLTYETPNVIEMSPDPIISSTHSSPQNSSVTYANLSQPEHTVDDSANYAIINDTSNLNDSPPLARSSSIKYVNDADDEPIYYNEPPVFTEQPSYYEQPGKDSCVETYSALMILSSPDKNSTFKIFQHIKHSVISCIKKSTRTIQNKRNPFSLFSLFNYLETS